MEKAASESAAGTIRAAVLIRKGHYGKIKNIEGTLGILKGAEEMVACADYCRVGFIQCSRCSGAKFCRGAFHLHPVLNFASDADSLQSVLPPRDRSGR